MPVLRKAKILAGILTVLFVATVFPLAGWMSGSGGLRSAAACHSHMPSPPTPEPNKHECCVAGHNWAILASALTFDPPLATTGTDELMHDRQLSDPNENQRLLISDSPPPTTSLRI